MAEFQIIMPKLGESIQEATITKWFVRAGDIIKEDDILLEVATDKVDTEIPSPVAGRITEILYSENSVVPVGELIALIKTDLIDAETSSSDIIENKITNNRNYHSAIETENKLPHRLSGRFISPLVRIIAANEKVTIEELKKIQGSGISGRIQKKDIMLYLNNRQKVSDAIPLHVPISSAASVQEKKKPAFSVSIGATDQIIEMDRVRKLIAENMVISKRLAPHVTSVVEADVTNLVLWREKNKETFSKKHGDKITYMPVFIEAVAKSISEFPLVNSSVDKDRIIVKKDINIGIAVAKPDGNLIVPVIRNADQKNLVGLTRELNKLAENARENKLSPDDILGATFTITNFGTFRNIIGTPIINQPQVAILATGTIEKKPAVIELPTGDAIVVRHKMFLSLSYDHRIIDGALGGAFLRRIADILEEFDMDRSI